MANTKKHSKRTQKEVMEALRAAGGVISDAAKLLDLASPNSLRNRVRGNETLRAFLDEIREETKDQAESVIIEALKGRDKEIAKWYLASQAKDRGYGNKSEVELRGRLEVEQHDLGKLSREELDALEEIIKKTSDAGTG